MDKKLSDYCSKLFSKHDALIFIMATGIVIRSIAPLIESKQSDPAVIVIDEQGRNVISLLSGHIGGANSLTTKVAKLIDANPVITTASDVNNLPSVDMLAMEHQLQIASMEDAKMITAMIVNNERIEIDDCDHYINTLSHIGGTIETSGKIVVSNSAQINETLPFVQLIPQNIVLGIGCRRNTQPEKMIQFVHKELKTLNIHPLSVAAIASIDIKGDEQAIIATANNLRCKLCLFSAEELSSVDHLFEGSDFVKKSVGVGSVSTTAAFYSTSQQGTFLAQKIKMNGMTLSVLENNTKQI